MIPDILYDLALKFKKTKLWMKLYDSQLFAVKHSDGTLSYCCVMGTMGEHIALAVYPGDAGLAAYRSMDEFRDDMDLIEQHEAAFMQDCLMVSFQNKPELSEREIEEVNAYLEAHGLVLRGKKAYPQFERFRPHHCPWRLDDPIEQLHLREALEAAFEVNDKLTLVAPETIGFTEGEPYNREIPLLEKANDTFAWRTLELGEPQDVLYISPKISDDITLAKLKKCKKRGGEWACDIFMHLEPLSDESFTDEPINAPYFPYVLLVVDVESDMIVVLQMVKELDDIVPLCTSLVEAALSSGRPSKIIVNNSRAHAFFTRLAPQFGAKLVIQKYIPALAEAKRGFAERFGGEYAEPEADFDKLMTVLSDPSAYADMPNDMLALLKQAAKRGELPSDIAGYVERECKKRGM